MWRAENARCANHGVKGHRLLWEEGQEGNGGLNELWEI